MNGSSSSSTGGGTGMGTTPDYSDMTPTGKLAICLWHLGKDRVYEVCKVVAESDSIGESWSYCQDYTVEDFEREYKELEAELLGSYLGEAGLDICLLFIDTGDGRKD